MSNSTYAFTFGYDPDLSDETMRDTLIVWTDKIIANWRDQLAGNPAGLAQFDSVIAPNVRNLPGMLAAPMGALVRGAAQAKTAQAFHTARAYLDKWEKDQAEQANQSVAYIKPKVI